MTPAQAILTNSNPTLLDIRLLLDLTEQHYRQAAEYLDADVTHFGMMHYALVYARREQAAGRPFGAWTHLQNFWNTTACPECPAPVEDFDWVDNSICDVELPPTPRKRGRPPAKPTKKKGRRS